MALPGGQLAFDRFQGNAEGQWLGTFVANPDGNDAHQITLPIHSDGGLNPVWSPDGKQLLLSVFSPEVNHVRPAIVNADGSGFHSIAPSGLDGDLGCSAWSPDGTTLLCSRGGSRPERDGIYSMRLDGTHLTQLTASPFHDTVGPAGECGGGDSRAVFSPDGKQFAFIRQKCGTGPDPSSDESGAIEVANSDGTGLHEIVPQGGVRTHPGSQLSWSPDGTEIAFGTQDAYLSLVHPDGSGLGHLNFDVGASGIGGALGPAWSPDGKWIVFSTVAFSASAVGTFSDLWIVAPDGTDLVKTGGTTSGAAFVDWGPGGSP